MGGGLLLRHLATIEGISRPIENIYVMFMVADPDREPLLELPYGTPCPRCGKTGTHVTIRLETEVFLCSVHCPDQPGMEQAKFRALSVLSARGDERAARAAAADEATRLHRDSLLHLEDGDDPSAANLFFKEAGFTFTWTAPETLNSTLAT